MHPSWAVYTADFNEPFPIGRREGQAGVIEFRAEGTSDTYSKLALAKKLKYCTWKAECSADSLYVSIGKMDQTEEAKSRNKIKNWSEASESGIGWLDASAMLSGIGEAGFAEGGVTTLMAMGGVTSTAAMAAATGGVFLVIGAASLALWYRSAQSRSHKCYFFRISVEPLYNPGEILRFSNEEFEVSGGGLEVSHWGKFAFQNYKDSWITQYWDEV